MKNILGVTFILGLICSSCSHRKVENAINGWWTMDTIYYKQYNIRACLGNNSIFFKIGDKTELPIASNNCGEIIKNSHDRFANCEILNSENKNDTIPFRLKFTTNNEIFSGIHKIVFYKDVPNHLLKMEIWSDKLYIVCRKGFFSYDGNLDLINDLEKMSWTNRPKD